MTPSPLPALYNIDEVAAYLRISRRTVRRLVSDGKLQSVKVGGAVRLSEEDILAFLRESASEALPRSESQRPISSRATRRSISEGDRRAAAIAAVRAIIGSPTDRDKR